MRKLAASAVFGLLAFLLSSGQSPCLPEGITFTTQAQIDNFQENYPGCTEIEGDVSICGDNIYNLMGLDVLTHIDGNLFIGSTLFSNCYNPNLMSLIGLHNLISVGGNLEIWFNEVLTGLNGLNGITSIGGTLAIYYNAVLSSLSGLEGVTNIGGGIIIIENNVLPNMYGLTGVTSCGGELWVRDNDAMINLEGLESLTSCMGGIYIDNNDTLTSLSGLEGLTYSGGDMWIQSNAALTSLSGLEGLTYTEGSISIQNNSTLTNLNGLEALITVGSILFINSNDALTSLTGLQNIDAGSIEHLDISWNPQLSTCHIQSICNYLSVSAGTADIHDNAPGCNSPDEVIAACEDVGINEYNFSPITIHPNPTNNGFITITLNNTYANLLLSCFNTFGKQVHQEVVTHQETIINISTWQQGIYLAVLYENGKPAGRAKFVVR